MKLDRRRILSSGAQLLLGFSLAGPASAAGPLPGDLADHPDLDAWLRVAKDGRVTLLTGKVELGQGILTALAQLCAEELGLTPVGVTVISGDTAIVPNEGATAGSMSLAYGGTAVRQASAELREILIGLAAAHWKVGADGLSLNDGVVVDRHDRRLGYGVLLGGRRISLRATGRATPRTGAARNVAGHSTPRIDLPAKVTGQAAFLQDLRLPGMLHARVIRRPRYGARLLSFDATPISRITQVVRDGDFLAVVAPSEWGAIKSAATLSASARWAASAPLPADTEIADWLLAAPADVYPIAATSRRDGRLVARTQSARYTRPFHMHGSIGPSVAIAELLDDRLEVWTHSQTVFETAAAIAELVGMPREAVRCRHMQGAGCYGHNGADDAAADAALIAHKLPGKPIRVQWSREDEHSCEPYGSAMVGAVKATVDDRGDVLDWNYDLWSMPHNTRPGTAGNLLAGQSIAVPFKPARAQRGAPPNYSADRNAIPYYAFAGQRVVTHLIAEQPVRVSATRSLGAFANVFAIESFMDELAAAAGVDPVAYRLRQLNDPRARAVIERAAARFGWPDWRKRAGCGRGIAFARYKNIAAYCAVALEVEVDPSTLAIRLVRAVLAADAGETVNPDGLANQLEGGMLQSLSWTLKERVRVEATGISSRDWRSYPILTIEEAPATEIEIVDQPGMPFLGAGEAAQGPAGAALANAVADATGARVRDMPITPEAIREALG